MLSCKVSLKFVWATREGRESRRGQSGPIQCLEALFKPDFVHPFSDVTNNKCGVSIGKFRRRKGNVWGPVLPSDAPACPFPLSSQLSLGLFSMESGYHALNHLTRQYFALISFWKSRKVKQLTCLIRGRGGVEVGRFISHNLVSWPGGGWCQLYPTSLLGSGEAVTTPDTQPGLSLHR